MDKRLARYAYFDPISEQDYLSIAEEKGDSMHESLLLTYVSSMPIQASNTESKGQKLIGRMSIFEISTARTKNETNGPWQEAIERGWMSW
jgi:hypothetical protein